MLCMSDELSAKSRQYCIVAEKSIKQLLAEFINHPAYFFSESDVKCRLFQILFQYELINSPSKTIDGKFTWPLHTEVSYFNNEGLLLYHVDLSAVDPSFTDMFSDGGVKLSKGYSAKMCYFAIELKLNKLEPKNDMMVNWIQDMDKLIDIKTRNPYLSCFSVQLDKTNAKLTGEEFQTLIEQHPNVNLLYANLNNDVLLNF